MTGINDLIPIALLGGGLLLGAHFLMNKQEPPVDSAYVDYPDFPRVGIDPVIQDMDNQEIWPHPYAHPVIPRYIGAPAYFQNSIPMDEEFYANDIWYDKNVPPLLVTVSQNQPTAETYSHHHFYFDQSREIEPTPLENGIFKNIV